MKRQVAVRHNGLPISYVPPPPIRISEAEFKAIKHYARELRDWATLQGAVETQMDKQEEFCCWWTENVRRKRGERWIDPADRRNQRLSLDQAEELTQMKNQQVSKWRNRLSEVL